MGRDFAARINYKELIRFISTDIICRIKIIKPKLIGKFSTQFLMEKPEIYSIQNHIIIRFRNGIFILDDKSSLLFSVTGENRIHMNDDSINIIFYKNDTNTVYIVNDKVRKVVIDGPEIVFYNDINIITKQGKRLISRSGHDIKFNTMMSTIFLPYNNNLFMICSNNDDYQCCIKISVTSDDIAYTNENKRFSSDMININYHYIIVQKMGRGGYEILDLKTFNFYNNVNRDIYYISEDYYIFGNNTNLPKELLDELKDLYLSGICNPTDEIIDITDKSFIYKDDGDGNMRVVKLPEKTTLILDDVYFMKGVLDVLIFLKIDSSGYIDVYTI